MSVALAGCTDGEGGAGAAGPPDPPGTPPGGGTDATLPPTWQVGDWWRFETTDGTEQTLVVYDQTATDWIVGTTSEDLAFFDARDDVSTLGPQRKTDLAGSQGETRVAFFQWPLTDGANWTTTWDGVERQIQVAAEADGRYTMTASEDGKVTVRYVYDPTVAWITSMSFLAPDGAVAFGWDLKEHGAEYDGEIVRWDLQEIVAFEAELNYAYSIMPETFTVAEGITDVWVDLHVGCTTGVIVGGVHPVPWDDQAVGVRWNEVCTGPFSYTASVGARAGEWNVDFAWQDGTQGPVRGDVYVRTLERVAVPAA